MSGYMRDESTGVHEPTVTHQVPIAVHVAHGRAYGVRVVGGDLAGRHLGEAARAVVDVEVVDPMIRHKDVLRRVSGGRDSR